MTRKFFSGKTLDQAVMMAARHYDLDPQELGYRQIEKRHGFLRTRKAVMIAVDPEQPRRVPGEGSATPAAPPAPAPPAPAPRPTARPEPPVEPATAGLGPEAPPPAAPFEPRPANRTETHGPETAAVPEKAPGSAPEPQMVGRPEEAPEEVPEEVPETAHEPQAVRRPEGAAGLKEARPAERPAPADEATAERVHAVDGEDRELLEAAEKASRILLRFAGIDAQAAAKAGQERIEVEIAGPDESVLVVEGGKGLLSIQHLLPRMLRGLTGRSSFVRADSGGFHQKRRDRLEALALKEAEAASRSGAPRTLPPMAPDERRIVHLALQESPTVVTESHGTGLHKRVVIRPADGFDEPGDIEARHGF